MKIEMHDISIRDLFDGYINSQDDGVVAYGGKLNVRPAYQREFVYGEKEQKAVINTIISGFPLNTLYWIVKDDGAYELLDGQQRTMSICEYIDGAFSIDLGDGMPRAYGNLTEEMKQKILDYKLTIYFCSDGTTDEQLDWFRVINIAGLKLTDQELRNAIYTGTWLSDAKMYFSKRNCPGYNIANKLVNLSGDKAVDRQGLLETAIKWIAERDGVTIEEYMAMHQHDPNANDLWLNFRATIDWIEAIFEYRKEMKGLEWGHFYLEHKDDPLDKKTLEIEIKRLMQDDDVTKRSGIYGYLLTGEEKYLSIRKFQDRDIRAAYERQNGICPKCGEKFEINEMQADHITPWSKGGKTIPENCQMLCADCNRKKSNI